MVRGVTFLERHGLQARCDRTWPSRSGTSAVSLTYQRVVNIILGVGDVLEKVGLKTSEARKLPHWEVVGMFSLQIHFSTFIGTT
jgi:hypothetical protein